MARTGSRRSRLGVAGSLLLWAALGALPLAAAAGVAGDIDTTFGTDGVSSFHVDNGDAFLLGIQSDGKLVVGTTADGPIVDGRNTVSWLIVRRHADGSADTNFGTNGEVKLFGTVRNDWLLSGCIDSDDRILCVGRALIQSTTTSGRGKKQKTTTTSLNAFTVVRLLANGALDTGFGTDGAVHTSIPGAAGGGGQAQAVTVQSNGQIVVAGQAFDVTTSSGGGGKKKKGGGGSSATSDALVVVRYDSDGALDTSFGTDGITVHNATTSEDRVLHGMVALQSSGQIVVGSVSSGGDGWGITRYGSDGSVDSTFGRLTEAGYAFNDLLVDSSDRIVAVGSRSDSSGDNEIVVARYLSGGALDTGFASSGFATTSFGDQARGFSVAIDSDGAIAVMCAVGTDGTTDIEAIPVRFTSVGALDSSFGAGGHGEALGAVGINVYPFFELELTSSGNLVTAGLAIDNSDGSFEAYVARWCGG